MYEADVGIAATKSDRFDVQGIVAAVQRAVGTPNGTLALHEPVFAGNEVAYLEECIKSTFVSSVGKFVDRFENMLEEVTGARRAIAVVNGTAALHACFTLAGVEAGDEVMSPALTFIATTNAIAYCGASPHFIDSSFRTLGMDAQALGARLDAVAQRGADGTINRETGRRIAAIAPMHTFGHPVDMDEIVAIARHWDIPVVEDAAESLGSTYKGHAVGSQARLAALSFNGNKIVTTGGGGAILTNDEELGRRAKHITTTAKLPHKWAFVHDEVGFNYRLPNLNAALGCAQLEQLDGFLASKRRLAAAYQRTFAGVPGRAILARAGGHDQQLLAQRHPAGRGPFRTARRRACRAQRCRLRRTAGMDADAPASDVRRQPARRSQRRRIHRAPADQPSEQRQHSGPQ